MRTFKPDLLTALTVIVAVGVITTMSFGDNKQKHGVSKEQALKIQTQVLGNSNNNFEFVSIKPKKALKNTSL